MEIYTAMQLFSRQKDSHHANIHAMDSTLPESAKQLRAEIEVFTLMKRQLEAVRKGDRTDLAWVALREVERCDKMMTDLNNRLKRYGRRNTIAV